MKCGNVWDYVCREHGEFVHVCETKQCKDRAVCPECGEEGDIPEGES